MHDIHTNRIFKKFNILKLEDLFITQGYQLYDKIMKKTMSKIPFNICQTRQSNNVHLCFIRTEIKVL